MTAWPRDNQADLIRFYGNPGNGEVSRQLVPVVPPFRMYYDGKPIKHLLLHRKCADAFGRAFDKVWTYYGKDQATLDRLRISSTAGTYACRKIRGRDRWSNHAFGGALDLDAEHNGFNTGHGSMPLPVVAAFKSEGMRWGGDYSGRTDPMHFEACASGQPDRTFEQWLSFYKQPLSYAAPMALADTGADSVPDGGVVIDGDAEIDSADASAGGDDDGSGDDEPAIMKPLMKSRTIWSQLGLGSLGLGGMFGSLDADAWARAARHILSTPMFWFGVICLVIAAYTIWLRYQDKRTRIAQR